MNLKALPSGQTALRRADFLNALVELVPADIVHFGKRLSNLVENKNGVVLAFEDWEGGGGVVNADVVVGCDGIRSRVKECMIPVESGRTKPVYSGMYGYRAVLDMGDMVQAVGEKRARVATIYVGKGAYAISYPVMRARLVNIGIYVLSDEVWEYDSWVRPAVKEDIERDTRDMGRYVKGLVEVCFVLPLSFLILILIFISDFKCPITYLFLSACPTLLNGPSSNTPISQPTLAPR